MSSSLVAPSALVFDVGNVLIRWNPELVYASLIPDAARRAHFLETVLPPEWNLEQDRGRGWPEAEAERIALFPEYADLIRAWRGRWHEMVPDALEANVAVLAQARSRGIPCYAITNFARDTFIEAQARFPFLTAFDGIVVSAHERLLKPDPAIFTLFLDRYGKKARDCLFIDDSVANVATARALGFSTIHVTGGTDLAREVASHGFNV